MYYFLRVYFPRRNLLPRGRIFLVLRENSNPSPPPYFPFSGKTNRSGPLTLGIFTAPPLPPFFPLPPPRKSPHYDPFPYSHTSQDQKVLFLTGRGFPPFFSSPPPYRVRPPQPQFTFSQIEGPPLRQFGAYWRTPPRAGNSLPKRRQTMEQRVSLPFRCGHFFPQEELITFLGHAKYYPSLSSPPPPPFEKSAPIPRTSPALPPNDNVKP